MAAHYQTTQGKAKAGDVTRALESVAAEDSRRRANGDVAQTAGHPVRGHHRGRWRVGDVMTTRVVTVSKAARYKDVVRLMNRPPRGSRRPASRLPRRPLHRLQRCGRAIGRGDH